jgi:hypothetical protein
MVRDRDGCIDKRDLNLSHASDGDGQCIWYLRSIHRRYFGPRQTNVGSFRLDGRFDGEAFGAGFGAGFSPEEPEEEGGEEGGEIEGDGDGPL